jgi:hypothetical protein
MRYTWLADVLRAAGLTVHEVSGWRTRGASSFGPVRGITVHHTAGSRTSSDAGEIRVLLNGSSSAPPPIAQLYLSRTGEWHVIAAGLCYHNKVGWGGPNKGYGNDSLLGIEAQHSGGSEPWTARQYDSYVRGVAALVRHQAEGWSPTVARVAGHREHQPGIKSDPTFNMNRFRTAVQHEIEEWDDMTPEQLRNEVRSAIRAELPAIVDAILDERVNVNVGYRAKAADGAPRAASNQRLRDVIAYLSPEGHETRDMLREVHTDLKQLLADAEPDPGDQAG